MNAPTEPSLRIGDVAKLAGTTPRTIRYYEEIGLLPQTPARLSGQHRLYTEHEVERLREVMRLKDLLGVSLDQLKTLLAAEDARAAVRAQLRRDDVHPERRRELLSEALGHIDRQLELVQRPRQRSWRSWRRSCARRTSACAASCASSTPRPGAPPPAPTTTQEPVPPGV